MKNLKRRQWWLKAVVITMLVMLSYVFVVQAENVIARYFGYMAIDTKVNERVISPEKRLYLIDYVDDSTMADDQGNRFWQNSIAVLLGMHMPQGTGYAFVNSSPNSMNVLLWHMIASGFAKEVARICDSSTPRGDELKFRPTFQNRVREVCGRTLGSEFSADFLWQFWLGFMAYDAPRAEFAVWRDYIQSRARGGLSAKELLQEMIMTQMLNPYFLLRH